MKPTDPTTILDTSGKVWLIRTRLLLLLYYTALTGALSCVVTREYCTHTHVTFQLIASTNPIGLGIHERQ